MEILKFTLLQDQELLQSVQLVILQVQTQYRLYLSPVVVEAVVIEVLVLELVD
jgi:hypothetical protein